MLKNLPRLEGKVRGNDECGNDMSIPCFRGGAGGPFDPQGRRSWSTIARLRRRLADE
jgi:hypothetical protein